MSPQWQQEVYHVIVLVIVLMVDLVATLSSQSGVCVSLGAREPSSLYIGPLFVSLYSFRGSQDTSGLRLHVIGPAARLAPSGGMAPLLVPLCYD